MRIAFVTHLYKPALSGGTGLVVSELSEGLSARGHECTVFCSNAYNGHWLFPFSGRRFKADSEVINGVRVRRLAIAWPLTAGAFLISRLLNAVGLGRTLPLVQLAAYGPWLIGLDAELAAGKFDAVYVEPFPFFFCRQVARFSRRTGIPYVLTPSFHEGLRGFSNPHLLEAARNAATVVAFTRAEAEALAALGVRRERLLVQPCGAPLSHAKAERDPAWTGKTVILFAGTKAPEKGIWDLLAAARKLESRRDLLFIAIGVPMRAWSAQVRRGLPGNFRDLGFVSDQVKQRLFSTCDIFALPSRAESFGMVYAEAWQYEKPVVGCKIPVIQEIIADEEDGLLVPFGDGPALTRALERLADDPELRNRLGRTGCQKARARFDIRFFVNALESAFRVIVEKRPGRSGS